MDLITCLYVGSYWEIISRYVLTTGERRNNVFVSHCKRFIYKYFRIFGTISLSCSVNSVAKLYIVRKSQQERRYILYSVMIFPFTMNNSCFCSPCRNRFKDFKILNGHQHSQITHKQKRSACTLNSAQWQSRIMFEQIFFRRATETGHAGFETGSMNDMQMSYREYHGVTVKV